MKKNEKKEKGMEDFDELMGWKIYEFDIYEHGKRWYIIAAIFAMAFLSYAFFSGNFLFAVILVLWSTIIILHDNHEPDLIHFGITDEGLVLGEKFIDYEKIDNFSIVYKPRQDIKRLYFEFKNQLRPRLSIEIKNMNPLKIREILLQYLQEDLEREGEPLSESLGRMFKI